MVATFTAGSVERARAFELPAGNHRDISRRHRGLPQRDAESSRPPPHLRKLRERQGAAVRDAARRRSRRAERRRSRYREASPQRTKAETVWFSGTHAVDGAWLDGDVIQLEGEPLLERPRPSPARPAQLRKRDGRGADRAIAPAPACAQIARAAGHLRARRASARIRPRRSTASPITTIRKPPASTPRSRPSTRSPAACGSFSAARTRTATTRCCASLCAPKRAPRC